MSSECPNDGEKCPNPALICPNCGEQAEKVISCAMPMKFCGGEKGCNTLYGFWSFLFTYVVAPIEAWINGGWAFMTYEGSYFQGLKEWFKADLDAEDDEGDDELEADKKD